MGDKLKFFGLIEGRFYHFANAEISVVGELADKKFGKIFVKPFVRGKLRTNEPIELAFKQMTVAREISREQAYDISLS